MICPRCHGEGCDSCFGTGYFDEELDDPVEGPLSNEFDADELGLDPEED